MPAKNLHKSRITCDYRSRTQTSLCNHCLLEEGFPVESISKILGHASPVITFSVYCGVITGDDNIRKSITDKLDPVKQYIESEA